jgi:hypothetical protein
MVQTPALVLSVILAFTYATLFHLWKGRSLRDLLFFWLASAVGFAAGQVVGSVLNLIPLAIGQIHVVEASAIALLFLLVARWLVQEKKTP